MNKKVEKKLEIDNKGKRKQLKKEVIHRKELYKHKHRKKISKEMRNKSKV